MRKCAAPPLPLLNDALDFPEIRQHASTSLSLLSDVLSAPELTVQVEYRIKDKEIPHG